MNFLKEKRGSARLRFIDRWLGIPLTVPAALYRKLARFPRPVRRTDAIEHPRRIGLLCLGAAGDALLASALADGIRRRFPDIHLTFIGSSSNAGCLPLLAGVDTSFAAPVTRLDQLFLYLRRQKFDILFDLSQWARIGTLLCSLSGAAITVGFRARGQYRSLGYDYICQHRADIHELYNFLALGKVLWPDLSGTPNLHIAECESDKAGERMIYCHMWPAPGRGRKFKQWPEAYWAELIKKLLEAGFQIGLTGSGEDAKDTGAFLDKYFKSDTRVASVAGCLAWPELAQCLERAKAVISVNTGVMHLAALVGAPTVALHGATNPLRWGPIGVRTVSLQPRGGEFAYLNLGFEYPRHARPALQNLPVADVIQALQDLGVFANNC